MWRKLRCARALECVAAIHIGWMWFTLCAEDDDSSTSMYNGSARVSHAFSRSRIYLQRSESGRTKAQAAACSTHIFQRINPNMISATPASPPSAPPDSVFVFVYAIVVVSNYSSICFVCLIKLRVSRSHFSLLAVATFVFHQLTLPRCCVSVTPSPFLFNTRQFMRKFMWIHSDSGNAFYVPLRRRSRK